MSIQRKTELISRVEFHMSKNDLFSAILNRQPGATEKLHDQMQADKIPGVSMAVIDSREKVLSAEMTKEMLSDQMEDFPAGVGLPLLDLGYLLLTSHFDLSQPLQLAANESIIRMIMAGYQKERPIAPNEAQNLGDAMHFLPAYQVGSYLHDVHDNRVARRPDFLFILQKMEARTNVIDDIFAIALPLVSEIR